MSHARSHAAVSPPRLARPPTASMWTCSSGCFAELGFFVWVCGLGYEDLIVVEYGASGHVGVGFECGGVYVCSAYEFGPVSFGHCGDALARFV